MLKQLQNKSKSIVRYWVFVFCSKTLIIIITSLSLLGIIGSGIDFSKLENHIENPSWILWVILIIFIAILVIIITEFVLIIRCIRSCNKLLRLNPPLELKEKILSQKDRLKWIIFIELIYLLISIHPLTSSIIFILSLYYLYIIFISQI